MGVDVYNVRKFVNGLPDDPTAPHANPVRNMHFPGAGVGGHCLPKDTWLLMHGYNAHGKMISHYPSSVLMDARCLNDWMPVHVVDLLSSALQEMGKDIKSAKVCVLGYAFLENSDDSRNTPSVSLLKELNLRGAQYTIHDPHIKETEEGYIIEPNLDTAIRGCDAIVLMTKHDEYKSIKPSKLKDLLRTKVIVDGRNLFDPIEFIKEGFVFRGVGKGNLNK